MLTAWHEVDNALTAYQTEQARRDQLIQAVAQNQRALGLAQSRYQEGVADFLQVLTAQQNLLSTQQQLALATTNVSANLVALYKALGGGWETQLPAANDDLTPIGAPSLVDLPINAIVGCSGHGRTPWTERRIALMASMQVKAPDHRHDAHSKTAGAGVRRP